MKPHAHEMDEGPAAFARFQKAMKTIIAVPKSAVMHAPESKPRQRKKKPVNRKG